MVCQGFELVLFVYDSNPDTKSNWCRAIGLLQRLFSSIIDNITMCAFSDTRRDFMEIIGRLRVLPTSECTFISYLISCILTLTTAVHSGCTWCTLYSCTQSCLVAVSACGTQPLSLVFCPLETVRSGWASKGYSYPTITTVTSCEVATRTDVSSIKIFIITYKWSGIQYIYV